MEQSGNGHFHVISTWNRHGVFAGFNVDFVYFKVIDVAKTPQTPKMENSAAKAWDICWSFSAWCLLKGSTYLNKPAAEAGLLVNTRH